MVDVLVGDDQLGDSCERDSSQLGPRAQLLELAREARVDEHRVAFVPEESRARGGWRTEQAHRQVEHLDLRRDQHVEEVSGRQGAGSRLTTRVAPSLARTLSIA